ncbi:MAG: hypothetical protein ACTSVW_02325 [Candidatus Njordarchaeales archaeon]
MPRISFRATSSFAQFIAILSIFLEAIASVVLFLIWTLVANIPFVVSEFWGYLLITLIIIIAAAMFLIGLILHTPLYEFISHVLRTFLAGYLSLLTLISMIVVGWKSEYRVFLPYSLLAIAIFVIQTLILYYLSSLRGKKLAMILRHKDHLNLLTRAIANISEIVENKKVVANVADLGRKVYLSWDKILKYELVERWDIAKIFFESLFLALVYFVTSTVIVNYQSQIISAEVMILSGVIAFSFIVLLTAIDLIRGERIRSTFY